VAELLDIGMFSLVDTDSSIGVGWKLNVYESGTSTRLDTFPTEADALALTNPNSNPVVTSNDGRLPPIWINEAAKGILTDENDVVKETVDPLGKFAFGSVNLSDLSMSTNRLLGRTTAGSGAPEEISVSGALHLSSLALGINDGIIIACSDETTAITTGTGKRTFRMPFAATLTNVRASVVTAPVGSTIIIDVNESGVSVLSTKLTIDAGEKTSTTAAVPVVISDTTLADDAEISIDFDQVGSGTAGAGVKVTLFWRRS
jgi:hypothetical protein